MPGTQPTSGIFLSRQWVKCELCRMIRRRVNLHRVITAVVQQFSAGQGRTEPKPERPPMMSFVQRRREAVDGAAQKPDGWNARQYPAFP